jgi:hypothetical protein
MDTLPKQFCWTRFGTREGESIETIVARKERERSSAGIFLWGIGCAIGLSMRLLLALERTPIVVFSPMLSDFKDKGVNRDFPVLWSEAVGLDGEQWQIPPDVACSSRGSIGKGMKRKHYALVCRSNSPLHLATDGGPRIDMLALRNLGRRSMIDGLQTTAVVERVEPAADPRYRIAMIAELAHPYFVELRAPIPI